MPFTISHAVLAPPIAKLTGYRLPISALAIGTMTPDLYRLFTAHIHDITHEWQGLIVPNLFIGLAFSLVWYGVLRSPIYKFLGVNKPLNLYSLDRWLGFILSLLISLIVGIASHLVWDGLTHADFRTFAFADFLTQPITLFQRTYPMHRILQIGTSALALPVLLWITVHHHNKFKQTRPVARKIKFFAIGLVIVSVIAGLYSYLRFSHHLGPHPWSIDLYVFTGLAINRFCRAFLLCFTLGCMLFLYLDHKRYFENSR